MEIRNKDKVRLKGDAQVYIHAPEEDWRFILCRESHSISGVENAERNCVLEYWTENEE